MNFPMFENKKVVILGFGVTGQEVYEQIHATTDLYIINDTIVNLKNSYTYEQFTELGIEIDICIKSPGVSFNHPFLQSFKGLVINDIELAYLYIKDNNLATEIIAITATNGKTSTTAFIAEFLRGQGRNAFECGNIGKSPLKILNENSNIDYLVMELSSYQLKSLQQFKAQYSLFLNCTPDHIDYHGTYEDYLYSKCQIFKNMTEDCKLYINQQVLLQAQTIDSIRINELIATIQNNENVQIISADNYVKLDIKTMMPVENYQFIYRLLIDLGFETQIIIAKLAAYNGMEHRFEYVGTKAGVDFINDSKATNVCATNNAINNISTKCIMLLGGSLKNEDYTLLDLSNNNIYQYIAYGANQAKFAFIPNIIFCENLQTAFTKAVEISNAGDTIILSPASASFDQFKNYEQRGQLFKQLVEDL